MISKNLTLGFSKLTNDIYITRNNKKGESIEKKDVTSDFFHCMVQRFKDLPSTIKERTTNKVYSVYVLDEEKHKELIKLIDEAFFK